MHQGIGLDAYNDLPRQKAVHAFYECCNCVVLAGDHFLLAHRTTHSLLGAAILFANISAAGVVYFGLTTLFRVPESVEMAALIKRKLGKSNSARK